MPARDRRRDTHVGALRRDRRLSGRPPRVVADDDRDGDLAGRGRDRLRCEPGLRDERGAGGRLSAPRRPDRPPAVPFAGLRSRGGSRRRGGCPDHEQRRDRALRRRGRPPARSDRRPVWTGAAASDPVPRRTGGIGTRSGVADGDDGDRRGHHGRPGRRARGHVLDGARRCDDRRAPADRRGHEPRDGRASGRRVGAAVRRALGCRGRRHGAAPHAIVDRRRAPRAHRTPTRRARGDRHRFGAAPAAERAVGTRSGSSRSDVETTRRSPPRSARCSSRSPNASARRSTGLAYSTPSDAPAATSSAHSPACHGSRPSRTR